MLSRCGIDVPLRGKFPALDRPDRNPSCEIYRDTIRDRSTGESFDVISIFAIANKITNEEAFKRLAAELPDHAPKPLPKDRKLQTPALTYSSEDAHALASRRGLSPISAELAGAFLGTLGFAEVLGFRCWILTDGANRIAEARRLDGEPFPPLGSLDKRKSHTLRGSSKSWPVGMKPPKVKRIPDNLPVVLVEGGPDYLAACDLLGVVDRDFLPVAMLGAGQSIHPEALQFFKGRKVTILAHPDEAGIKASRNWFSQILEARGNPKAVQLEGGDLNDLVSEYGAAHVAKEVLG